MDSSGNIEDSLTQLMKNTIEKCREDGYILCTNGMYTPAFLAKEKQWEKRVGKESNFDPKQYEFDFSNPRLRLLFSILPLILHRSDRKHVNSYSGKHIVEDVFRHSYISNGEFILVSIALGYKFKYISDTPNCSIYGIWANTMSNMGVFDETWYKWKFDC